MEGSKRRWRGQKKLCKIHELEAEMFEWVKTNQEQGVAVSKILILPKSKCWAKDKGVDFQASLRCY